MELRERRRTTGAHEKDYINIRPKGTLFVSWESSFFVAFTYLTALHIKNSPA